jgi:PAS domain S-box-containing protein
MNLRTKLILPLVALLAALSAFIYGYWLPVYVDHATRNTRAMEESKIQSLVPSLVTPILTGNLADLYALLKEQRDLHTEWVDIRVWDAEGRRLFPVAELGAPPQDAAPITRRIVLGRKILGDLVVYVNIQPLVAQETRILQFLANGLLATLVLASLVVGLLQEIFVRRPIRLLSDAAARLKRGEYEAALPPSRADEIGQLSERFSAMRDSIKDYQVALESEAARLRAVLENVVEGILTVSPDGKIETFNPAAERIFGYHRNEAIGQRVAQLLPEFSRISNRTADPQGRDQDIEGIRKDGSRFPAELAISRMRDGETQGRVAVVRDITQRKRVERMKDEFVSTVSHELRTPLTSIRGSLGLINGGLAGQLSADGNTLLQIASRNCERLIVLINDLLDVSKIESGDLRFNSAEHPLQRLMEQALDSNRGYADERGIVLRLENHCPDATVDVDEDRFMQVMANLLSNATKFSPEGGQVEIQALRHDQVARICVVDHGGGVPDAFRERIFQKFSQADASDTRQKGGTGLGLSISKALIDRMGGRMDFCDTPGGGATFFFELPLTSTAPAARNATHDAR